MANKNDAEAAQQALMRGLIWYNHLTSTGIVIIGGILAFSQGKAISKAGLLALLLVALGAATSAGAASRMIVGRPTPVAGLLGVRLERFAHLLIGAGAITFIVDQLK